MSVRSLLGLAIGNLVVLGVGCCLLWGARGLRSWAELARLSGLAYLIGVATLGVVLSVELVAGVPFGVATIMVPCLVVALAGLVLGRLLGRPRPRLHGGDPRGIGFVAASYGALLVVYVEALFRASRLAPLSNYDGWAFWVPKAEAIYFLGGLDEQFFGQLPNPTYPPLVPALEAAAFHAMGSADVVTLHVQFWCFLTGFVAAVGGLLAPRVHAALLWPVLLFVLVAPRVVARSLEPQADFLLDYFFVLAALLVGLWLLDRRAWQLGVASLFLGGAMVTKREGALLAVCVMVAALVASWRTRRFAWPRIVLAGGCALALAAPWRIWFSSRGLTGEFPTSGFLGLFEHLDRPWPALQSVAKTMLDYELWLLVLPLAGLAIALALVSGARLLPVYATLVYGLSVAGFVWVLWSFTEIPLPFAQDEGVNPIVRLCGSLVLLSAGLVPLLLDAAWRGGDRGDRQG
ncbi:MAG TPA: hypothetical protein VFI83_06940 [Gaiella sp.]|jgi:hypothetical protein|nr:hypothetical protein [Gaiella sp.]